MMKSPKAEVRSAKEGRRAKAEVRNLGASAYGSATRVPDTKDFWVWGDVLAEGAALREEGLPSPEVVFDLEERSARFAEEVIRFARKVSKDPVTNRLVDQMVGAGASIAANYAEARDGVSRKDFRNRVGTSRKESRETMLFLRLIAAAEPQLAEEARRLWLEARELNRIFGAIWRKTQ
jgi:four helix bundle protein